MTMQLLPLDRRAYLSCLLTTAVVLSIAACSFQKTAPDPAEIERQIADAKAEELDLVRATIDDPERTTRFIDLLAERDRLIDDFVDDVARHRSAMARLDADYDAERSDFEALLAEFNTKRAAAQGAYIDLVAEMKETTSGNEWKKIAAFQAGRLEARQLAYRDLPVVNGE